LVSKVESKNFIAETMKNVVLIRHGESLGQIARERGVSRKHPSLEDCLLGSKGVREASQLRSNDVINQYKFDLVCTSPLSRALATCVLALGHIQITERENQDNIDLQKSNNTRTTSPATSTTPFLARSDICEFGKGIPENRGRPLDILVSSPSYTKCIDEIDFSMIGPS
jgi:hypothetical protein